MTDWEWQKESASPPKKSESTWRSITHPLLVKVSCVGSLTDPDTTQGDISDPLHLLQRYKHNFHPHPWLCSCNIFSLSYKLELPSDQDTNCLLPAKIKVFATQHTTLCSQHPSPFSSLQNKLKGCYFSISVISECTFLLEDGPRTRYLLE